MRKWNKEGKEVNKGSINKQMATLGNWGGGGEERGLDPAEDSVRHGENAPYFDPPRDEEAGECTYQLHSTALWLKTAVGH